MGGLFGGLASLAGGLLGNSTLKNTRKDIKNLSQFDPRNFAGPGGQGIQFDNGGNGSFNESGGLDIFRQFANAGLGGFLQGGQFFNDPNFQQALQGNDLAGAQAGAQSILGQQANPFFNGPGFQQAAGNAGFLGNQFSQLAAGGVQDFTNGLQNTLFNRGNQTIANAGDVNGLINQNLDASRALAQPFEDRLLNRLENRQFAQGRLGTTGGAQQFGDSVFNLAQADNQRILNAQQLGLQQSNQLGQLGLSQIGQGSGLLGQNLGQFNQNAANAQGFLGLGAGFEGQGFNQLLGAQNANISRGQQRLANAQNLFGLGQSTFNTGFGQGNQLQQSLLGQDQFGLSAFLGTLNAEANRVGGASGFANGMANAGANSASGIGGFLGGLGSIF